MCPERTITGTGVITITSKIMSTTKAPQIETCVRSGDVNPCSRRGEDLWQLKSFLERSLIRYGQSQTNKPLLQLMKPKDATAPRL